MSAALVINWKDKTRGNKIILRFLGEIRTFYKIYKDPNERLPKGKMSL